MENAVVGFLVEDPSDGRILEANEAACRLLERSEDELVGMTWREITHPEDRESGAQALAQVLREERRSVTIRKRYVSGTGRIVWSDVTLTCVRDGNGRPKYNIAQVVDARADTSLAGISRVIADDPTGDELCAVVLEGLRRPYGAVVYGLYLGVPSEDRLHLVGSAGWCDEDARAVRDIPMSLGVPVVEAAQTGSPIFMRVHNIPEIVPFACEWFERHPWRETGEVAAFPVLSRGKVFGVQYLEFSRHVERSVRNVEAMTTLGHAITPWLMMARRVMETDGPLPAVRGPLHVSDRQRSIVRLVRDGRTNREIAESLGYSEATVRADLSHLSRMLGAHGRREVVMKAGRAGM